MLHLFGNRYQLAMWLAPMESDPAEGLEVIHDDWTLVLKVVPGLFSFRRLRAWILSKPLDIEQRVFIGNCTVWHETGKNWGRCGTLMESMLADFWSQARYEHRRQKQLPSSVRSAAYVNGELLGYSASGRFTISDTPILPTEP